MYWSKSTAQKLQFRIVSTHQWFGLSSSCVGEILSCRPLESVHTAVPISFPGNLPMSEIPLWERGWLMCSCGGGVSYCL